MCGGRGKDWIRCVWRCGLDRLCITHSLSEDRPGGGEVLKVSGMGLWGLGYGNGCWRAEGILFDVSSLFGRQVGEGSSDHWMLDIHPRLITDCLSDNAAGARLHTVSNTCPQLLAPPGVRPLGKPPQVAPGSLQPTARPSLFWGNRRQEHLLPHGDMRVGWEPTKAPLLATQSTVRVVLEVADPPLHQFTPWLTQPHVKCLHGGEVGGRRRSKLLIHRLWGDK